MTALVFGIALSGTVGTEEYIPAAAESVRKGDDGLAALFVKTVLGNAVGRHNQNPFAEDSALDLGFRPHRPTQTGTFNLYRRKVLCRLRLEGFEPPTYGSVGRYQGFP